MGAIRIEGRPGFRTSCGLDPSGKVQGGMTHYHVWFSLKPEVGSRRSGLRPGVHRRAPGRRQVGAGFGAEESGDPAKSRLPPYHALFEFRDDEQMNAAFAAKRVTGIHAGPHGQLMASIAEFRVEIFRET